MNPDFKRTAAYLWAGLLAAALVACLVILSLLFFTGLGWFSEAALRIMGLL